MVDKEIKEFFRFEEINTSNNVDGVEVTVWCTTYNHIDYIEKALNGFLNQGTTFKYEIIVFDDASTDGTSDIVRRYAAEYPDIIKAYIAKKNTYNAPGSRLMREKLKNEIVKGRYIALCEGDDYWIYPKKLQRQYDILEKNDEISMCFHNAIRVNNSEIMPQIFDMETSIVDDEEVFFCKNGRPPTASFFYRAEDARDMINSNAYLECPVGDDSIRFHLNNKGKIYYLDKCWAVRNYMHAGSWNERFDNDKDFVLDYRIRFYKYYELFNSETVNKYKCQTEKIQMALCEQAFYENKPVTVDECLKKAEELTKLFGKSSRIIFNKLAVMQAKKCEDYYDYIRKEALRKKVYIYGAGVEAKNIALQLQDGDILIKGFVVTDKQMNPSLLLGKSVNGIDDIDINDSTLFVLGLNDHNKKQVFDILVQYNARMI